MRYRKPIEPSLLPAAIHWERVRINYFSRHPHNHAKVTELTDKVEQLERQLFFPG